MVLVPEEGQISIAKGIAATNISLVLSSKPIYGLALPRKYTPIDNIRVFLLAFTDNEIMTESIFGHQ